PDGTNDNISWSDRWFYIWNKKITQTKTQIKKTNNTQAHQPHTSGLLQPLPDTIYHNVSLRAPLKRAERDSAANTAKRDVFPGVNRKNASGSLSAHCIAMHESEWRSVWGLTAFIPSVFDSFSPGS
ncbi:hypothetical protein, partial [Escherichia coli]|uniref:hypothetical protein n=1 Tax=Escherichia coli TaxID=562 RepID=UPI00207C807C